MNQEEKKNKMLSSAILSGLCFGGGGAFIVGWIFQFLESLKYIVSFGTPEDIMQSAFLKGAAIGGLFGCFVGSSLGALISKVKNQDK